MHALRMHTSKYAHGISAPTCACMACRLICKPHAMWTSPTHPQREGHLPMRGAHPRYILWAPPLCTPHPTGGGSITITIPPFVGGRGGGPQAPRTYIYKSVYMYCAFRTAYCCLPIASCLSPIGYACCLVPISCCLFLSTYDIVYSRFSGKE